MTEERISSANLNEVPEELKALASRLYPREVEHIYVVLILARKNLEKRKTMEIKFALIYVHKHT